MGDTLFDVLNIDLLSGAHNLDVSGDIIFVALYLGTSNLAGTPEALDFRDDITDEISDMAPTVNYTLGGQQLLFQNVTLAGGTVGQWDADDVVWASSTITAAFALVYKWTGTEATERLIASYDFGGNVSSTNGNFTIQWNANGLIRLS